jgi:hypothetical protein
MRGVGKNTVIQVLAGIVAIEGYLQFEHVTTNRESVANLCMASPFLLTPPVGDVK